MAQLTPPEIPDEDRRYLERVQSLAQSLGLEIESWCLREGVSLDHPAVVAGLGDAFATHVARVLMTLQRSGWQVYVDGCMEMLKALLKLRADGQ